MTSSPIIDSDGFFQKLAFGNPVSATLTGVSTASSSGVLLVFISYEGGAGAPASVSGIVDTAGLSFTKRQQVQNTNSGTENVSLELWWAHYSSALSSDAITVTMTGICDGINVVAAGVTGCYDNAAPFDLNVSLPASTATPSGSSPPTVSGVSTTSPDDLILFLASSSPSGPGHCSNPPTGFNGYTNSTGSGGGSNWNDFGLFTLSVSAAQSGQSYTLGGSSTDGYVALVDALTANPTSSTETGTAEMAFGPFAFAGSGGLEEHGSGALAFGPFAFDGAGLFAKGGSGVLAFGPFAFHGVGDSAAEVGSGAMGFGPPAIKAYGAELGVSSASAAAGLNLLLSQQLQPLTWNVPIADKSTGLPTNEFMRKWQRNIAIFNAQL
jgi:hypothetical protein